MASRPIVIWPNEILHQACSPITDFGTVLQQLIDDMIETATRSHAVGLAAPQVAVSSRVMVVKVGDFFKEFVNPVITPSGPDKILVQEGCLSVPWYTAQVKRYRNVSVSAFNRFGEPFTLDTATGQFDSLNPPLTARLQHELDHLNGKTFMDDLSELKRSRAMKTIKKRLKHSVQ